MLGLPYVREMLKDFITEKELLIQMKALNTKDSPAIERSLTKPPFADRVSPVKSPNMKRQPSKSLLPPSQAGDLSPQYTE